MTFTRDDLKRVLWTVIQAGVGAAVVVLSQQSKIPSTWDEGYQILLVVGAAFVAGAISALKNLFLSDGSALK